MRKASARFLGILTEAFDGLHREQYAALTRRSCLANPPQEPSVYPMSP